MSEPVPEGIPVELLADLYGDNTPCILQLVPGARCQVPARNLVEIGHAEDRTPLCGSPAKVPACEEHTEMFRISLSGFWSAMFPSAPCAGCDKRVALLGIERIGAS